MRLLLIVGVLLLSALPPQPVRAQQMPEAQINLGRVTTGAISGNDVEVLLRLVTPPQSLAAIHLKFPGNFRLSEPASVSAYKNTISPGAEPLPGDLSVEVSAISNELVLNGINSSKMRPDGLYGFTVAAGAVQNPSQAGAATIVVESYNQEGALLDSVSCTTYVTDSSVASNEVSVTTTVLPNLSLGLDPALSSSDSANLRDLHLSITTNSPLGYTVYVRAADEGRGVTTHLTQLPQDQFSSNLFEPGGFTFAPGKASFCSACGDGMTNDQTSSSSGAVTEVAFKPASTTLLTLLGFKASSFSGYQQSRVGHGIGSNGDHLSAVALSIIAAGNY